MSTLSQHGATRWCEGCQTHLPLDQFIARPRKLFNLCHKCLRRRQRQRYAQRDPERLKDKKRAERARNHERYLQRDRAYYAANREKIIARVARWRQENKERERAGNRRRYAESAYKRAFMHVMQRNRRAWRQGAHGTITVADWERIKAAQDFRCLDCKQGEPHIKLTIDHIIPISKGGSNAPSNVAARCRACNTRKYNRVY